MTKIIFRNFISISIHHTDLVLTNYIKNKVASYNLAPEQALIMILLWEKDGLTQNQITEKLKKDKTNVARMVSNLEKKGFVRRTNDKQNWRALNIYLTERGKEVGDALIPISKEFNEIISKGISYEELTIFKDVLTKIQNNVR